MAKIIGLYALAALSKKFVWKENGLILKGKSHE